MILIYDLLNHFYSLIDAAFGHPDYIQKVYDIQKLDYVAIELPFGNHIFLGLEVLGGTRKAQNFLVKIGSFKNEILNGLAQIPYLLGLLLKRLRGHLRCIYNIYFRSDP